MFNFKNIFSRTDNPDNLAYERYPFEVGSDAWMLVKDDIKALNNSPLIYQMLAHVTEAAQFYENGNPDAFAAMVGELHYVATDANSEQVKQALGAGITELYTAYPEFGNVEMGKWEYLDAVGAFVSGIALGFSHAIKYQLNTEPDSLAALKRMDERQYEKFVKPYGKWMLDSYTQFMHDMDKAALKVLKDALSYQEYLDSLKSGD